MASVTCKAKLKEHWHKPQSSVYRDNYGFAINYYQPMIDYLDAKENNVVKPPKPHIPWSNERALAKYRPSNVIRCYSHGDLRKLAEEAEYKAKESLQSFKIAKRTDLSLSSTVHASKLTKKVLSESKIDNVRKSNKHVRIMGSYENLTDLDLGNHHVLRTLRASSAVDNVKDILLKKSARHVEASLLNETYRNLSRNTEMDVKGFQRRAQSVAHDHVGHTVNMNIRQKQMLEENSNFKNPLGSVKYELDKFSKKTDSFLKDSRFAFKTNPTFSNIFF